MLTRKAVELEAYDLMMSWTGSHSPPVLTIVSEVFDLDLVDRDLDETDGLEHEAEGSSFEEHVTQSSSQSVEHYDTIAQPDNDSTTTIGQRKNVSDEATSGTVSETDRESIMDRISHEIDVDL